LTVALTLGLVSHRLSRYWLASQLRERAENDENVERAIASVAQLARLDDSGWLQLVELIDESGDRSWVSDAARTHLSGKLRQWRQLSLGASAAKVQRLAARLRTRSEAWGDDTTRFAGQLARTMLRWPIPQGTKRGDLVGDCEFLIYRAANLPATSESLIDRMANLPGSSEWVSPTEELDSAVAEPPAPRQDVALPETLVIAAGDSELVKSITAASQDTVLGPPDRLNQPEIQAATGRIPPPSVVQPYFVDDPLEFPIQRPGGMYIAPNSAHRLAANTANEPSGLDGGTSDKGRLPLTADVPMRRRTDREVIQQLMNSELNQVLLAERELRDRGYSQAKSSSPSGLSTPTWQFAKAWSSNFLIFAR
jgi:hypothetical protein